MKEIGWKYQVKGNSRCKSCDKYTTNKPRELCESSEHKNYYFNIIKPRIVKYFSPGNDGYNLILKSQKKLREETLMRYGGKCSCCGFNDMNKKVRGQPFLQIDHINGKKNSEDYKEKYGDIGGQRLYHWLKKHNYPDGYRTLCIACNNAIEYNQETCELHKWEKNINN